MITVTCECGAKLRVKNELVGKKGKCPKCGQIITLVQQDLQIVGQWEGDAVGQEYRLERLLRSLLSMEADLSRKDVAGLPGEARQSQIALGMAQPFVWRTRRASVRRRTHRPPVRSEAPPGR